MKKIITGNVYGHGGLPHLYRIDNDLTDEQKNLMAQFMETPPTIEALCKSDVTDRLIELGYLLTDVEPVDGEEVTVTAIPVACPKERVSQIAKNPRLLFGDLKHVENPVVVKDDDIEGQWTSVLHFLLPCDIPQLQVKVIHCIRAMESALDEGEVIHAVFIGHGENSMTSENILSGEIPFSVEAIAITNKRFLNCYEHDTFAMRDAGYIFVDGYDVDEVHNFAVMTNIINHDGEDADEAIAAIEMKVKVKASMNTHNSKIAIKAFSCGFLEPCACDDFFVGSAILQANIDNIMHTNKMLAE